MPKVKRFKKEKGFKIFTEVTKAQYEGLLAIKARKNLSIADILRAGIESILNSQNKGA